MNKLLFFVVVVLLPVLSEAEIHPLFTEASQQFENKQYDSALTNFNQLLQQYPEKKESYFNRGLCLYSTEKFSEAILDFNECLTLDSVFDDAQFLKGMSLQKSGELKAAMHEYSNIHERNTGYDLLDKRIKNYRFAVYLSTRWYYMIMMAVLLLLLITLVVGISSSKKGV